MTEQIKLLETGLADIDDQHAQLLACLDELKAFVGGKYEFAATFTAVQTLLGYTEQHFTYEEDLLRRCDYPELEEHINEHARLITEVRHQWARIEQGDADIAREVVETIERWIVDHINSEDVEYAKFIQAD